jgi:hypothetical protein
MISEQKKELLRLYNQGLTSYKLRKWDDAVSFFQKALKIDPKDGPSAEYLKRSQAYKVTPPPADWDGVFVMTTK